MTYRRLNYFVFFKTEDFLQKKQNLYLVINLMKQRHYLQLLSVVVFHSKKNEFFINLSLNNKKIFCVFGPKILLDPFDKLEILGPSILSD